MPREVIAGANAITYAPTAGDVVLFNSRNPHEIAGAALFLASAARLGAEDWTQFRGANGSAAAAAATRLPAKIDGSGQFSLTNVHKQPKEGGFVCYGNLLLYLFPYLYAQVNPFTSKRVTPREVSTDKLYIDPLSAHELRSLWRYNRDFRHSVAFA